LSFSPLIDTGTTALSPSDDFRALPRPSGNGPDIGAIELGAQVQEFDRIFQSGFNLLERGRGRQ
jgi:hypothetical protein